MTTPDATSNDSTPSPDDERQRCTLYLLGELDAQQALDFERQLQSTPDLGSKLMEQADLVMALSQVDATHSDANTISPPATLNTPAALNKVVSGWSLRPYVASLLAVSACLALIFVGTRGGSDSDSVPQTASVSEDLLIARAWADSHLTVDTENVDVEDFAFTDTEAVDLDLNVAETTDSVDSTLSWMFIAVAANVDETTSGATNDG